MDLHVDDDGFVRAPAPACYRVLTDLGGWADWWPGARLHVLGDDALGVVVPLVGPPSPLRRRRDVRLQVTAGGWRHDVGFQLSLVGEVEGRAEFWLEAGWGGAVVHHVAALDVDRDDPLDVLATYRWWVRQGLWALKDRLQAEQREQQGLPA